MEPKDDILIPPTAPRSSRRMRSKHILRILAVLMMAAALGYADKILHLYGVATAAHRRAELLPAISIFLFGILLWWYAGRKLDEFSRPLFRNKNDAVADMRVDLRNVFWLGASLVSGFVGLSAVIIGWVFVRHGEQLRKVLPSFFANLEKRLPPVRQLEVAPEPLILTGVFLVVLAGVTLALAMRRRRAA